MDALGFVTLASAQTTVTFSGIPQTYTHLHLRISSRTARAAVSDNMAFNPNGSAVTTGHYLYGQGTSASAGGSNPYIGAGVGANTGSNIFSAVIVDILDYTNVNKSYTIRTIGGWDGNGSGEVSLTSVYQTSAIPLTNFTLTTYSGTAFQPYSTFYLYGVK